MLTDEVTVNLNIGFSVLGTNILGSTGATLYSTTVDNYYATMFADRTSVLDQLAYASLPTRTAGAITVITPGYVDPVNKTGIDTTTSVVDADGSTNNSRLIGTAANLKALGFTLPSGSDASITFNSAQPFDFNPADGIAANSSDFIGVAIHEIGHALGFVSGVDRYDGGGCPNGPGCMANLGVKPNNAVIGDVLDLFRYSGAGALDWRPGKEAYFSIDGGVTELFGDSNFSTGQFNGDGFQASHWKAPVNAAGQNTCQGFIGVMNPYLCGGQQGVVTASDLAAMDAIGWNLNFNVLTNPTYRFSSAQAFALAGGVPEPATWTMMIAGFAGIGLATRRRRRVTVRFAA